MSQMTQARLMERLTYDPETGVFRWKVRPHARSRARAGDAAGGLERRVGYRVMCLDGVTYTEHRLAWLYMTGAWPSLQIDHRNRIKSDNRWFNLREVTASQNAQNVGPRGRRSIFCGAHWIERKQRWHTHITIQGRRIFLGEHATLLDAAAARISAENRLFTHRRGT